jgi:hypothetical protein
MGQRLQFAYRVLATPDVLIIIGIDGDQVSAFRSLMDAGIKETSLFDRGFLPYLLQTTDTSTHNCTNVPCRLQGPEPGAIGAILVDRAGSG